MPKANVSTTKSSQKSSTTNTSSTTKNFNENSSVKAHATSLGENNSQTDASQNVNNGRPITTRDSKSSGSRPITARSAGPHENPAEIQTRLVDPDSGRLVYPKYLTKDPVITSHMFQQWTPDLLGLPADSRPVRSTRNKNPQYINTMWTASAAEIDSINQSISTRQSVV